MQIVGFPMGWLISDFPLCDLDTEFTCQDDKNCLPVSKRCDGKPDCFDHTDEYNCGKNGKGYYFVVGNYLFSCSVA